MAIRKSIPKKIKTNIFHKCNKRCAYCGEELTNENFVVEHENPICRGGDNSYYNLLPSCAFCNRKKGTKTSYEFWTYLSKTFDRQWISRAGCNFTPFSYENGKYILHFFWEYDWCTRIASSDNQEVNNG